MGLPYEILEFGQVQIQVQVEQLTPDNLAQHLKNETARIRNAIAQHRKPGDTRKAVVLVDTSVTLMPDALTRKIQADWMKENEDLFKLVVHSMGFVIPSAIIRGTLTAVFWIAPMPMPVTTHESMDQALDWAIAQLDHYGEQVDNDLLMNGVMAIERKRAALPQSKLAFGRGA